MILGVRIRVQGQRSRVKVMAEVRLRAVETVLAPRGVVSQLAGKKGSSRDSNSVEVVVCVYTLGYIHIYPYIRVNAHVDDSLVVYRPHFKSSTILSVA